jgi:hypothetical protein
MWMHIGILEQEFVHGLESYAPRKLVADEANLFAPRLVTVLHRWLRIHTRLVYSECGGSLDSQLSPGLRVIVSKRRADATINKPERRANAMERCKPSTEIEK